MSFADELRAVVAKHGDRGLEFERSGYRVSLNPVGSNYHDAGFILWRATDDGGWRPIVTGRTAGGGLAVDDPTYDGDLLDLEAVIRAIVTWGPARAGGAR
jgi:hypothetical protein